MDESNIKVVTDHQGNALFMSRSPLPHPKTSVLFDYYKHLGVLGLFPCRRFVFLLRRRGERMRLWRILTNCGSSKMEDG